METNYDAKKDDSLSKLTSKITLAQINAVNTDNFTKEEWTPLVKFFWDRYSKRYFDQIKVLQGHADSEIKNNCGFLIVAIDCILIETLEQYYSGRDETTGHTHDPFYLFFQRSSAFDGIIQNKNEAGLFAGYIRSGLLHQSKTKKASIINKRKSTPILSWIDEKNKKAGFAINRDKFHKSVFEEFENLIKEIKKPEKVVLRKNFISKLKTILEE